MVRPADEKPNPKWAEASIVAHWDDIFKKREWGKYPDISLVRYLANNFSPLKSSEPFRVLELGSGPGANLGLLARSNFQIWCIDGSATAIHHSKQRLNAEGLLGSLKGATTGQLTEVEFQQTFFDLIIDVEVLSANSFKAASRISKKAINALKPGGKLFGKSFSNFTTVDGDEISYNYFDCNKRVFAGMGPIRISTKEDIFQLFESQNTTVRILERDERHFDNGVIISEWCFEVEKN